ncbi:MAG: hypothetical protein OXG35_30160 [Acidobacteria bacterium]|nr:hypothetical protein [Acidobacteriota bacterium]
MTAARTSYASTPDTETTGPTTAAMTSAFRAGATTTVVISLIGTAAAVIWPTGIMYWVFLATGMEAPTITAIKLLPWIAVVLLPEFHPNPGPRTAYTMGALLGASLTLIVCSTGITILRALFGEALKFIG